MKKLEQSLNGHFLVCPPDYFDVIYEINVWMSVNNRPNQALAKQQWDNYFEIISKVTNQVEILAPHSKVPDLVFTANHALVRDGRAVLALMKTPERRLEQPYYTDWFKDQGFETYLPEGGSYEGEGDSFLVEDCLLYGLGFRSDRVVANQIQDFFHLDQIIFCELTDPYFYHLDTCVAPLGEGRLLVYPNALTKDTVSDLSKNFEIVEVIESEAKKFSCNIVVFEDQIIMPAACPDTQGKLESLGFTVHTCELTQYLKAGGSAKCLCLKLWN